MKLINIVIDKVMLLLIRSKVLVWLLEYEYEDLQGD